MKIKFPDARRAAAFFVTMPEAKHYAYIIWYIGMAVTNIVLVLLAVNYMTPNTHTHIANILFSTYFI